MTPNDSPTCRWCAGPHSIADCPEVLGAFGPVKLGRPQQPPRRMAKPGSSSNTFNRIKLPSKKP